MEEYRFKQTYGQIQELLDKLELLPTRAELDAMLDGKQDKPIADPYFTVVNDAAYGLAFITSSGETVLVGDPGSYSALDVESEVDVGNVHIIILANNASLSLYHNAEGCNDMSIGIDRNIPMTPMYFQSNEMSPDFVYDDGFAVGACVACGLTDGLSNYSKICEIKHNGEVVPGWWIEIPKYDDSGLNIYPVIRNQIQEP